MKLSVFEKSLLEYRHATVLQWLLRAMEASTRYST